MILTDPDDLEFTYNLLAGFSLTGNSHMHHKKCSLTRVLGRSSLSVIVGNLEDVKLAFYIPDLCCRLYVIHTNKYLLIKYQIILFQS